MTILISMSIQRSEEEGVYGLTHRGKAEVGNYVITMHQVITLHKGLFTLREKFVIGNYKITHMQMQG